MTIPKFETTSELLMWLINQPTAIKYSFSSLKKNYNFKNILHSQKSARAAEMWIIGMELFGTAGYKIAISYMRNELNSETNFLLNCSYNGERSIPLIMRAINLRMIVKAGIISTNNASTTTASLNVEQVREAIEWFHKLDPAEKERLITATIGNTKGNLSKSQLVDLWKKKDSFLSIQAVPYMDGLVRKKFFPNGYGISIIRTPYTYGGPDGLYEIAVLKGTAEKYSICYDSPITNDVIGWVKEEEVDGYVDKVQSLPNEVENYIDNMSADTKIKLLNLIESMRVK